MASSSKPAKEAEGESTMGPNWLDLPRDVTAKILHKLGAIEIVTSARLVCPLWWNICKDPLMWRTIHMHNLGNSPYDLHKICRYAVDRSCGQLEDINIEKCGTNDLLNYIADNSGSHLRRLRLTMIVSRAISDEGLSGIAKKLPLLEELDISYMRYLSKDSLEAIGQCCPLLKVLKFNWKNLKMGTECDDEAFVIAKTMPQLLHLQLLGNKLTDDGLVAILDGCPLLESLDLRDCFFVKLSSGRLWNRCEEQIKDFRFPHEGHSYKLMDLLIGLF